MQVMRGEKKITLEKHLADKAWNYASENAQYHMAYSRDTLKIQEDIYVGKMGEIAYCLLNGVDVGCLNFECSKTIDPGFDLIRKGYRVDVKTTSTPSNRVRVNPNYSHCDKYAIMEYNTVSREFRQLFHIDRRWMIWCARQGAKSWYLDISSDLALLEYFDYIDDINTCENENDKK